MTKKKISRESEKPKSSKNKKIELAISEFVNKDLPELSKSGEMNDYKMMDINISLIETATQVRKSFSEESIAELAQSMDREGLISPIELRKKGSKYIVIAGERRLRAAKYLGWPKISAIIRYKVNEEEIIFRQYIENIQREDLSPIDESVALNEIKEKFGLSNEEIGERIGKSKTRVGRVLKYNSLLGKVAYTPLLKCPVYILDELVLIQEEPYFRDVVDKVEKGQINSSNIRVEIKKAERKYLVNTGKITQNENEVLEIADQIEANYFKYIEQLLLKVMIKVKKQISPEIEEEISARLNKIRVQIEKLNEFLIAKNAGELKTDMKGKASSEKKSENYPSTRLEDIGFKRIDSKLARNKNDVINFITEKIDIQKDFLIKTPLKMIVDHWNALPDQGNIDHVANFLFSALKKNFKFPITYLNKKRSGDHSYLSFDYKEADEEDKLMSMGDGKERIEYMRAYLKNVEDDLRGDSIEDLEEHVRERYLRYKQEIDKDRL